MTTPAQAAWAVLFVGAIAAPGGVHAQAASAEPSLTVVLNGQPLEVALDHVGPSTELASLLPPKHRDTAAWHLIAGQSQTLGQLSIQNPTQRYADHTFRLYRDPSGAISLGVFRNMPNNIPERFQKRYAKPVLGLADVRVVDVWTVAPPENAVMKTILHVRTGKREVSLTGKELRALSISPLREASGPVVPKSERVESERARKKRAGWRLADVLAQANAPRPRLVVAVTSDNVATRVDPTKSTLRLNRRGQFSVYYLDKHKSPVRLRDVKELRVSATAVSK